MVLPKFGICRNGSEQAGDSAGGFRDCSRGRFNATVNGRRTQSILRHDRTLAAVRRALQHKISSPLTDILRNKVFASKRSRRSPIPWLEPEQQAFLSLKSALTSFPIVAFPVWGSPFVLHTDACADGAGVALTQDYEVAKRIVAYASHR